MVLDARESQNAIEVFMNRKLTVVAIVSLLMMPLSLFLNSSSRSRLGDLFAEWKKRGSLNATETPEATPPHPPRPKPAHDFVPWLSPLLALVALIIVGYCTGRLFIKSAFTPLDWKLGAHIESESFLRLAAAIVVLGLWYGAVRYVQATIAFQKADWWNLDGRSGSPSWEMVRRMALNDLDYDPVVWQPRFKWFRRLVRGTLSYMIIGALLIEGLHFLAQGPILPKFLSEVTVPNPTRLDPDHQFHTIDLALNANLTALLALIAAAISIYFTHRQLQAKVKADSRQAWLDKLRGEISRFIALADAIQRDPPEEELSRLTKKMTASRLEMELMLNPSEKDHRLLMFLSIKIAFFQLGDEAFKDVHDVENLVKAIESDPYDRYDPSKWNLLLGAIPEKDDDEDVYEKAYSDLIGYVLRLSHVVLKREWERVKEAR
jgi:hypothetical protein